MQLPLADSIPAVMAVSTLDIVNVTAADAGIYTCAPSNARNHSVVVHVVKGKKGERIKDVLPMGKSLCGGGNNQGTEGRRLKSFLGLSLNDRMIIFLIILLDKTVSVG